MRVTVFLFHPFPKRSKANRVLWEAIQGCPGVEARDMYELYPEFAIDVEREQDVLLRTDVAVLQHPYYWYNCPSLMKEWIDSVLEHGWAYGPGGEHLAGKHWLQAITTGGSEESFHRTGYNRFSMQEFLRPFEQTARLCGMTPHQPFVTHGTFDLAEGCRKEHAMRYRALLLELTQGRLPAPCLTEKCAEVRG